ncbi:MAG: dockerin type I repeat-containing protein [Clostridium sp.]|nr:dockerin type I repeat-containing protein [Clostridium sp.]MDD5904849.1 dockerin type I repeat-containing protein [Clostridium sp.]
MKRSFKLPQFTIGDVNNDGQINAADANLAMRMAPNLMEALPSADANEDGNITAADANIIMRWALSLG